MKKKILKKLFPMIILSLLLPILVSANYNVYGTKYCFVIRPVGVRANAKFSQNTGKFVAHGPHTSLGTKKTITYQTGVNAVSKTNTDYSARHVYSAYEHNYFASITNYEALIVNLNSSGSRGAIE